MILRRIARLLVGLMGFGFIFLAILAYRLGLDKNPAWGSSRIALFVFGLTALAVCFWSEAIALLTPGFRGVAGAWQKGVSAPVQGLIRRLERLQIVQRILALAENLRSLPGARGLSRLGRLKSILLSLAALAGIAVFYWWVVTSGQWTVWPTATSYYDKLADAFLHGQVSLLEKPSFELLSLKDPYDLQERLESGASYPSDVSLYQGKFFVYWGPAPALIFLAIKNLAPLALNDAFLVIGFCFGALLWMGLLFISMSRRFFSKSPGGRLFVFLLTAGVTIPIPYLLARPGTYEASIAGGQFFLLAALTFIFWGLKEDRVRKKWLVLGSVGIILAAGTRISLAFALLFLSFMVVFYLLREQVTVREKLVNLFVFTFPQALGAVLLLFYNFLRFDSLWEFGMRYALSVTHMPKSAPYFLHTANILPNLYLYLFRLPEFTAEFPFLSVPWVDASTWPFLIRLPPYYYYSEPVAGLVVLAPVVLFAWFAYRRAIVEIAAFKKTPAATSSHKQASFTFQTWWLVTLCGLAGIICITVLMFFASTMRYMMDFVPLLVLLSFFGDWMAAQETLPRRSSRWGRRILFLVACFVTILAGLLLSMSGPNNHLLNNNPVLYETLGRFFDRFLGL
ncbi:MAG: hypothetical protein HPY59_07290 [Anaerolineae bacterium]|nr:hypothetical protein [Anaerolineae bacterium]